MVVFPENSTKILLSLLTFVSKLSDISLLSLKAEELNKPSCNVGPFLGGCTKVNCADHSSSSPAKSLSS